LNCRGNNRERNVGWRLDYFVINEKSMKAVKASEINNEVLGSDHCPIELELDVTKL
jgi:exodeoxyribonuclease-3